MPIPRINVVVWKDSQYCTAFPMPYFSGRKSVSCDTTSFKELIPSLDRIAAFFVAFVFVTLVDSAGRWQRYPTVAVTVIFIALLIWCSLETWGERPILGGVFRFLSSSSKSDQSQGPPYQPTTAQPEQHDNQGARRLSVRIDPKSVAD